MKKRPKLEVIRKETADERGITPISRGSPRAADPDSPGRTVPRPQLTRPYRHDVEFPPPEPAA